MKQQLETKINPYESPRIFEPREESIVKRIRNSEQIMRSGLGGGIGFVIGGESMNVPELSLAGYLLMIGSTCVLVYRALKSQNRDTIIEYE